MSNGIDHIAQSAISVVSRYGIRKATMGDIAAAAGVSRQTLYNTYANKEQVIQAAIRYVTDTGIRDVHNAWDNSTTLSEQLDRFFEIGPLSWFELVQSSPDAADLIDGLNLAGGEELAKSSARWTQALENLFLPYKEKLTGKGVTAKGVAELVYSSSHSAKTSSGDRVELAGRLQTLKQSILSLVGEI